HNRPAAAPERSRSALRRVYGGHAMARERPTTASARTKASSALAELVRPGDNVLVLDLDDLGGDAWSVLSASGLGVVRAADTAEALRVMAEGTAQIAVTGARQGQALIAAARSRADLADVHVIVGAD